MGPRFTHNATMAAYLVLASAAGALLMSDPMWGAIGVSAVLWPLVIALRHVIVHA